MMTTFFHGRRVRGWPWAMLDRRSCSRWVMSLWRNTLTLLPECRIPSTIDLWLNSSDSTRQPLPMSSGMVRLLVAKPMP